MESGSFARGREEIPAGRLLLVTCVDGRGRLSAGEDQTELARGKSCVVPAATKSVGVEGRDLDLLVAFRP